MAETERQLTEAIREGDRAALRRLYERYVRYGMAIALRIVADEEDALDVVHDAFVSILTSIDTFDYRGEGSLKAWVARIVTNKSLSWLKDNDKLQLTDQLPEEPANDDDAPIEAVPPNVLNAMISRLPKRKQDSREPTRVRRNDTQRNRPKTGHQRQDIDGLLLKGETDAVEDD